MILPGDETNTAGGEFPRAGNTPVPLVDDRIGFFVIQDYKENRRKCTVQPLAGSKGLEVLRLGVPVPGEELLAVPPGILLEMDAPELQPGDAGQLEAGGRIVFLDATWVRLAPLGHRLDLAGADDLQRRSLPSDFRTAYPRRSKLFEDPGAGLASVEAMFAVTVILGAARPDFLRHYRWSGEFLELNREVLSRYGWEAP